MNDTNTSAETMPSMPEDGHDGDAGMVAESLAEWWHESARDLPWRFGRATPWGVLVSEVMSQQTQMSRVVPYWQAWMERWPDAAALADAPKADVITAWGRLGYPRRALRLQECARMVADDYHDDLPRTYDELVALPGIGDYTASAVMSFAYGERIAVIDTNIRRVLSRVFLGAESRGGAASPAERALANKVLPEDSAAAIRGVESKRHGIGRGDLHGEKPAVRTVPGRCRVHVPRQRPSGIGGTTHASPSTVPRYRPAGARAGAERVARTAGWANRNRSQGHRGTVVRSYPARQMHCVA